MPLAEGMDGASSASPEAIRHVIERLYREGRLLGDDGLAHPILPVGVTRARGEFIAALCRGERPAATLEVGMARGLSTLFILGAIAEAGMARPGCHVVMDPFQGSLYYNAALRTLRENGLVHLVEFYAEPSGLVLPRLVAEGRRFDFIFIDGDHRFDGVFVDFFFAHQLLRPGGLMVFDDPELDGVYLTCRFAESNYGYQPEAEFPPRRRKFAPRWQVRRLRRQKLERPFIRAYRKPTREVDCGRELVPFFDGFVPWNEIPKADPARAERNRLNHLGRLSLRRGDLAEARLQFRAALEVSRGHIPTRLRLMRTYLPRPLARFFSGKSDGRV
jgi:predicted O-methyltransferase YrrM